MLAPMKTVYHAANILEAHMLVDLLKQDDITAHIRGAHLQGAIGELPAAGLLRLEVDEDDHAAARDLIERWEKASPAVDEATSSSPTPPAKRPSVLTPVLAGLFIGVACTFLYLRAPMQSKEGIDHDGDGVLDERWFFSASGQLLRTELDRNLDKKTDYVAAMDEQGQIKEASADDDFNGSFETRLHFKRGNTALAEVDLDGDERIDMRTFYRDGVAESSDYLDAATQAVIRTEHFELGHMTSAEIDMDGDGKLDTREHYSAQGRMSKREAIVTEQ